MMVRCLALVLLASSFVVGACRKAEVATYRVPKEKEPELPAASAPAGAGAGMAATAVPTAEGPALTWSAPSTWRPKPASAMRKGSYTVAGDGGLEADLSITAFGGDVGGELANLNRWRGQLQLSPVSAGQLASAVQRIEHNGLNFGFVDLTGESTNASRTLGAWTAYGGATWFFKLSGPAALLEKEKTAFLNFLATVKPAAPAP